jgi:hypothetical protein
MSVTETVIIRPLIKSTSTFLHLAAIHSVTLIESKLSRSKDVQRRVTVQHWAESTGTTPPPLGLRPAAARHLGPLPTLLSSSPHASMSRSNPCSLSPPTSHSTASYGRNPRPSYRGSPFRNLAAADDDFAAKRTAKLVEKHLKRRWQGKSHANIHHRTHPSGLSCSRLAV